LEFARIGVVGDLAEFEHGNGAVVNADIALLIEFQ